MKKFLIIINLLTLCACGSAQIQSKDNCKYQRNEIDDFTGKQIKETTFYHISKKTNFNGTYLKVGALKNGNINYLQVSLLIQGRAFNLEEGKELMFLDVNKNVTKLIIPKTQTSDYNGTDAFYVIESFPLDSVIYEKLINTTFVKARYETMDGYLDFDIPEKSRNAISSVLKCIQ
ncbi:MAG: hypothetical protein ACTIJ9_11925 [Aequorivita sp.]